MRDQLLLIYSYLHGIWRYRWSALVISWIVALIGWTVVYALPSQYTSKAIMHVDTESIMRPLLEGLTVESGIEDALNVMSRIILSRENLEEVIRQTDMDLKANNSQAMDKLVKDLAGSIQLEEGDRNRRRKSNIYELSYKGDSAEHVYQVVSKLLNTLIEKTLNSTRTDTAAAQQFLDRQIAEYEGRLTIAEQGLAEFKQANVGFMPDVKGGYYNRLQREQGELDSIRSELELAKRRLTEMRKQLQGEAPLLDSNSYGSAQLQKLRGYREQLENLLTQYTEEHPDVQALRSTIADVMSNQNADNDEFVEIGSGDSVEFNPVYQQLKGEIHKASVEVETLKIKLIEKTNRVETLKQSVDIIPEVEAKLSKLNRDYEITRERYLDLVDRRESARLAQEVGQSGSNINFKIIDPPRVPSKPSGPNRYLLLTAVLFVAMSAGLGWGFLRYLLQPTFVDSSQIRDKIGLPILGSVGLYLTAEHKKRRQLQLTSFIIGFILLAGVFVGALLFSGQGSELVNDILTARGLMI